MLDRDFDRIDDRSENAFGLANACGPGRDARADKYAVSETGNYKVLYIVRDAEAAAFDNGIRLSGTEKSERTARADAELERFVPSRRIDDLEQIIRQHFVNTNVPDTVLDLKQFL